MEMLCLSTVLASEQLIKIKMKKLVFHLVCVKKKKKRRCSFPVIYLDTNIN